MDKEILSTARELIKQGHSDFTVELLIKQVPCSRGSFYKHYNSIDELLLKIFYQAGKTLKCAYEAWIFSTDAHHPKIVVMLRNTQDAFLELGPIITLVTNRLPDVVTDGQTDLDPLIAARIAVVAPWVDDPLSVGSALSRIDTAMWLMLVNQPLDYDPDTVFNMLYDIWCSLLKIEPGSEKHTDDTNDQHDCWETTMPTYMKLFTG
jgi:AcrR family transcriptional regulator